MVEPIRRRPPHPRMRITHVSHELPPHELAGTAIYTLGIAKAQAAAGHDVSIFARLQDPAVPAYRVHDEKRDRLRIRFVNRAELDWVPLERSYRDDRMKELFAAFLDEVKPEVVHFQHLVGLGLGCLEAVTERGIRCVMTVHDFWAMCPMGQRICFTDYQICDPIRFEKCGPCVFGSGWQDPGGDATAHPAHPLGLLDRLDSHYRALVAETPGRFARRPRAWVGAALRTVREVPGHVFGDPDETASDSRPRNPFAARFEEVREAFRVIDLLITPSAFARDEFIKHFGVTPDRIVHSANGMELSAIERRPKIPSHKIRFGYVGSIMKTKGIHVLVDAFVRASAGRSDLELHVFGSANRWGQAYFDSVKQQAASCPFVTFHGRFDRKDVSRVLQQFDVLVVPSIWFENAPLTLNEAAISATPVLTSEIGGMLEFVRANQYGWTFRLGDVEDLASKMLRLADEPALLSRLASRPPKIKSVEANATELVTVYRRLIDGTWRTPDPAGAPRADTSLVGHG
jgi:glycosyltransferase involved in cell wall biosynthesis